MSAPLQSIIVYRNPAEAAIWEALSSATMIPIFMAAMCFIIVLTTTSTAFDKFFRKSRGFTPYKWEMPLYFTIAGMAAVGTFKYFYLG